MPAPAPGRSVPSASVAGAGSARNIHVDFFRGLALWWIFLDHTPFDRLAITSIGRVSVNDAAEIFVLLTGMAAAYAYGGTLARRGYVPAALKMVRRAATIYVANLVLFAALLVEAMLLAPVPGGMRVMDAMGLSQLLTFQPAVLGALLTFDMQPLFVDILPLYVFLLLGFAVVLPLLRRPVLLLTLSVALYAATQVFGLDTTNWPVGADAGMNPLGWQVLMVLGAVMVAAPSLRPRPRLAWDVLAIGVVAGGFVMHCAMHFTRHGVAIVPPSVAAWLPMHDIDKEQLHPFRLLNFLGWAYLAWRVAGPIERVLRSAVAAPFRLCGRRSLPVFCTGILLNAPAGWLLQAAGGWLGQVAVNVAGAAIMVAVAALAEAGARRGVARAAMRRGAAPSAVPLAALER